MEKNTHLRSTEMIFGGAYNMPRKNPAATKWKTAPISPTCEVRICDEPTVAAYPACGGGWMALCERHAKKHLGVGGATRTDELIRRGEK